MSDQTPDSGQPENPDTEANGFPPPPPPPSGPGASPYQAYSPGPGQAGPAGYEVRPFSVGEAYNYGWTKFQSNVGPIILVTLAALAASAIIVVVGFAFALALRTSSATTTWTGGAAETMTFGAASFFVLFLFSLIAYVVAFVIGVGIIRAALDVTYGRPVTVSSVFSTVDLVPAFVAMLLVGIAAAIGFMLCFLPGLIVVFFTSYTLFFVVDKKMSALEAIKASVSFVNRNLGTMIGMFVAYIIAGAVGDLFCLVGALVAFPVSLIAQAFAYRRLQGETVAA